MREKVTIRRANYSDIETIRKMVIETDNYYYNNISTFSKSVNKELEKHQKEVETFVDRIDIEDFWILIVSGVPAGVIMVWDNKGETTLVNFYVEKKYRGKGYGRKLLDHAIKNMKTDYCVLSVYKDNKRALEFYYRYGFKFLQLEESAEGDLYWLRYDK